MSLATGREIYRNKWAELPVGDEVLSRIKSLAIQEGQPPISTNLVYKQVNGRPISDSVEIDNNSVSDSFQNKERVKIIPPILYDTFNPNTEEKFNDTDRIVNDNGILDNEGEPIESSNHVVLDNSLHNNNEEENIGNTTVLNEEEFTIEQEEPNINNNNNEEEIQILNKIEEEEVPTVHEIEHSENKERTYRYLL